LPSLAFYRYKIGPLLVWAALALFVPYGRAQTRVDVSGQYSCTQAKVRGKVIPCRSAPLVLKGDGRYEIRGREGEYFTKGSWLVLTDQQKRKRAKIVPGHKLLFRYQCGKGMCEVQFERRIVDLGVLGLS